MITTQHSLTYEDLLRMPDDGKRYELIGGNLFASPSPTAGHQDVVGNLYTLLRGHARDSGSHVYLAPFDVIFGPRDVVQPDLMYLSARRTRVPLEEHALKDPPDLVVEVVAPGTGLTDRTLKLAIYAAYGVPEYWIADPRRRTLVVYVLDGEEYRPLEPDADGLIPSRVLSGMNVDPDEVFSNLE